MRCANDASLFCRNGGTCFDTPGGTTLCRCPTEWAGGRCEMPLSSTANQPPAPAAAAAAAPPGTVAVPTWVAAPIIIGIVLIVLLGAAICYMASRERRGAAADCLECLSFCKLG